MACIEWKKHESLAIINMCNGANKQNLEFVAQMNRCFDQILADKAIFSIVLTSTDEKNFSQGIDIQWLEQKMKDKDFYSVKSFLYGMNKIFKRILLMPVPVIAAINGHAFGNGAMLACACDFRFMKKDKGFFCFPEVDINIPFFSGMIKIIRKSIPEYKLNEMILSGKRLTAMELEDNHVIVKASANQEELLKDTVAFAKQFMKKRGILGELKKRMHKDIIRVMDTEDIEQIDSLSTSGCFVCM
ncbi:enoyl-CoA hydratase/isomerase family protein [Desulfobacula toluolica]|uniref:Ech: enoyl-CoA hydratase/isomerase n=1 Tax=Desulfobacula toluolica (strain DSM 7467 / Tol2) TaxID=651182 RepID=K0N3S1_DESTT|nr:enoyl-CoA hydratase/isomerase family protein [Desulfobacula toluolica]CCK78769.1 Ech: enoyl-CoA hydratase/isomerase [Desulfobacula toluolica Tol2]